jgi:hypothetical protein
VYRRRPGLPCLRRDPGWNRSHRRLPWATDHRLIVQIHFHLFPHLPASNGWRGGSAVRGVGEGRTYIVLLLLLGEHAPNWNQKVESSIMNVHVLEGVTGH